MREPDKAVNRNDKIPGPDLIPVGTNNVNRLHGCSPLQRGFGIIIYVIVIAVLAAAFVGYGQYRYGQGVDKERTRNLNAALEKEVEMSKLRRTHADEIEKFTKRLSANSEAANQKIRDLLQTNKVLLDWWNAEIPKEAHDYIWLKNDGAN